MALLFIAVKETSTTVHYANLSVIAAILEKDRTVSDQNLEKAVAEAGQVRVAGLCRTELVSAATTVLLKNMDRKNAVQDFDDWSKAVTDTERHLRFAAGCMPGDSNVWLRYAALRSVIAENPEEVARLMHLSRRLAPADSHMLLARLGFWNSFSRETLELAADDVNADLQTLMNRGEACVIGRELKTVTANLKPYAEKIRQELSPERLKQLSWECPGANSVKGPFKL